MFDNQRDFQGADWDKRMIYALKQLKRHPTFCCPDCAHLTRLESKHVETIECETCGLVVNVPHAKDVWLRNLSMSA
jgi:transcription elongation factor Elf1